MGIRCKRGIGLKKRVGTSSMIMAGSSHPGLVRHSNSSTAAFVCASVVLIRVMQTVPPVICYYLLVMSVTAYGTF